MTLKSFYIYRVSKENNHLWGEMQLAYHEPHDHMNTGKLVEDA